MDSVESRSKFTRFFPLKCISWFEVLHGEAKNLSKIKQYRRKRRKRLENSRHPISSLKVIVIKILWCLHNDRQIDGWDKIKSWGRSTHIRPPDSKGCSWGQLHKRCWINWVSAWTRIETKPGLPTSRHTQKLILKRPQIYLIYSSFCFCHSLIYSENLPLFAHTILPKFFNGCRVAHARIQHGLLSPSPHSHVYILSSSQRNGMAGTFSSEQLASLKPGFSKFHSQLTLVFCGWYSIEHNRHGIYLQST